MVVFVGLALSGTSRRGLDGDLFVGPVPTSAKSDIPESSLLGDAFALAISDFGDSRPAPRDTVCASLDVWLRKRGSLSLDGRGGVKGEGDATGFLFDARVWGDGVSGILPPAVFVENMP